MYSRRQRSTRNAAATTNASASTNARTTRGRTSKAKHPRRGGGNPDTARVRASIEKPPVVPWIKVMRPPALHLRRTFLVEKWVRPADLTEEERGVYEAEQKKKAEERQRLLKWQQQKREQEEREKERLEQQKREQSEKEQSQLAAAAAAAAEQAGENAKPAEPKESQGNENSTANLVTETPTVAVTSTITANDPTATKTETKKSEAATAVSSMELEQTQAPSHGGASEEASTLTPVLTSTTTVDVTQDTTEQKQNMLTESTPSTQVAPDSTLVANANQNLQEEKQALPQNNEFESKEMPAMNSLTPTNLSATKPPTEGLQQQQEQKRPSDPDDTSVSTEPLAKKPRVE